MCHHPPDLNAKICIKCGHHIIQHDTHSTRDLLFNFLYRGWFKDIEYPEEDKSSYEISRIPGKEQNSKEETTELINNNMPAVLPEDFLGIPRCNHPYRKYRYEKYKEYTILRLYEDDKN